MRCRQLPIFFLLFCSCSTSALEYALSFFFFFQAEDGIRDFHVTGVQTCALPISPHTAFDGDSLFVLSVGDVPFDLTRVGVLAADAVARAIARGVRAATSLRDIPAARDLAAI